jgi:hypothetical protein
MARETLEQYVERRVKQLISEGMTDFDIMQQLTAVSGRKLVAETLAAVKQQKV